MFTVEIDFDEIAINVLDDTGKYEDMQTLIYDDIVYIKQWNEEQKRFYTVAISPQMFHEFLTSINQSEGSYHMR